MGIIFLSFLVTTVLIFIGFYLLFKKFSSKKKPLSSPTYWITAIFSTPIFYVGFIFLYFLISSFYETKEFDKQNWAEDTHTRYVYVDDLIDNEKLIGLTNSELINLLGEPDYEDATIMTFNIGYDPKHFLNMDPDWLETELTNGKVTNVSVRE